jgi:hypothetical protein
VLLRTDQQARGLSDEKYQLFLEHRQKQQDLVNVANTTIEIDKSVFSDSALLEENRHVNALWIGSRLSKVHYLHCNRL